jgi:peroxin-12
VLHTALLRTWFALVDMSRPGLFATVLGFKLAEWWFNTAQAVLQQGPKLAVPPPPPRLPIAEDGIPLPPDARMCPMCLRVRTNPAVAAPSGMVFCYPCIRDAVERTRRCPVTGVAVQANQVRRLYTQSDA